MIERYGTNDVDLATPVHVTISEDSMFAAIMITDQGGGLPPSAYSTLTPGRPTKLSEFFFSTSPPKHDTSWTYSRNFGAQFDGLGSSPYT